MTDTLIDALRALRDKWHNEAVDSKQFCVEAERCNNAMAGEWGRGRFEAMRQCDTELSTLLDQAKEPEHEPGCPATADDESDYEHLADAGMCVCRVSKWRDQAKGQTNYQERAEAAELREALLRQQVAEWKTFFDSITEPVEAKGQTLFHEYERIAHAMCHKAGCKCPTPLLGWTEHNTPRCRLCNVEVEAKGQTETPYCRGYIEGILEETAWMSKEQIIESLQGLHKRLLAPAPHEGSNE